VEVLRTNNSGDELELLQRFGAVSHRDAATKLTAQRYSADDAELQLKVLDLRRLDVLVRAQADLVQKLFIDGVYDSDQLRAALDALPITDDEKHLRQVLAATHVELPRKFQTLAQMTSALEEGIVDVSEYDGFLVREGYGPDDATIIRFLSPLKTANAEEARAATAGRAAARAAAAKAKAAKGTSKP